MRRLLFLLIIVLMLSGCTGGRPQYTSTHSITKYVPASQYSVIVISEQGPQLEPEYYEELGTVEIALGEVTPGGMMKCVGILFLLKSEAKKHGADALIHAQCGQFLGIARASGIAIIFKNREESLKRLKEIEAVIR
jgi:hypothetical protein